MDEKRSFSPPVVGGSSLLVIFAVLCLTIFALLSLSTVQADGRLSDASAQAVSAYYQADCAAEEILARIRAGQIPEGVEDVGSGLHVYRYAVPISDTQELRVTVTLFAPDVYHVTQWQAVSTVDWTPDDSLDVWNGEEDEFLPIF